MAYEFDEEDEAELLKMFGIFSSEEFRFKFARDKSKPTIPWAFSEQNRSLIEEKRADA